MINVAEKLPYESGGVDAATAVHTVSRPTGRIAAIDLLRGLVVVIMGLDHARDFFSLYPYSATDLSQASPALFLTRWITHFCAPVFVFLAGTSAWLHARNGGLGRGAMQRFLVTRGLWLVFLELTWNSFMWRFSLNGVNLQVLWALGGSMVVLAASLWLPTAMIVVLGAVIVAGHNLLDGIPASTFGEDWSAGALAWHLLHEPWFGKAAGGFHLNILYPLLPWVGVMLLGYGFGAVLAWERVRHERFMRLAGLLLIGLFLLLRLSNSYGEPAATPSGTGQAFTQNPRGPLFTLLGVLNLTKYPPSLQFLLMTLGPALLLMPWLEGWRGRIADVFTVFGRVPMFFYLLHVPLLHLCGGIWGYARYGPAILAVGPENHLLPGYTPSLVPVYAAWLLAVAALYPACRRYGAYKQRNRRKWWLSYL